MRLPWRKSNNPSLDVNDQTETSLVKRLGSQVPASLELSQSQTVKKQIVKKYGIGHAIFRPLGIAIALLIGVYASVAILSNYWRGYQRDLSYRQAYHIDKTAVQFFQDSLLSKDKVELIIRNYDGQLEKRFASNSQLTAYIKARASELETAKQQSLTQMQTELEALFETAFADRQEAVENYADWFFEWKRPYVILKEAISSTTSRMIKLGEYESLRTAVERDMKDYFMRHYKEQVLKPEERDAIIVKGIETVARHAHQHYLSVMAQQDEKMRTFLAKNTTYLETISENQKLTLTKLDWDVQRWKTPTYLMEDRAFDGIAGMGRVAVGGTLGALAIGPAMNRGLGSIFTSLSRRFASSMGARITLAEGGAVAGTVVEPVGGTIVGAAIGVALGFAADYVINKVSEKFSRGKFLKANNQALENTMSLWREKLSDNLSAAYGRWYDEAKAGLIIVRDKQGKTRPEVVSF